MPKKYLIIQTAFTGDVILATALVEKLIAAESDAVIDMLVRKGNESLLIGHPHLKRTMVWNKNENKYGGLLRLIKEIRDNKYDEVINVQRFATTGLITAFSGAKVKRGFSKNPFSFLFTKRFEHTVENGMHETERNQFLLSGLTDSIPAKPKVYPSVGDFEKTQLLSEKKFITIAPGSVWFTKTVPAYKWVEFIQQIIESNSSISIYLIGAPNEKDECEQIKNKVDSSLVVNLAGQLSLLQSAALMSRAIMNYTNDSAPLHLASAMNAPVTVVYCSTVPLFGFGPLSDKSKVVQTRLDLSCRPCGLHGYLNCPLIHFKCAHSIEITDIL